MTNTEGDSRANDIEKGAPKESNDGIDAIERRVANIRDLGTARLATTRAKSCRGYVNRRTTLHNRGSYSYR
jgi:hypothetical protein